ncbi:hypothetical protein AMECASPLE_011820 [Ameca splendens]|uniref:Uncharacterized protein n=1 Tax=Ameca splendens TaxID=208324 RepID=A0ABV0YN10_9TELE
MSQLPTSRYGKILKSYSFNNRKYLQSYRSQSRLKAVPEKVTEQTAFFQLYVVSNTAPPQLVAKHYQSAGFYTFPLANMKDKFGCLERFPAVKNLESHDVKTKGAPPTPLTKARNVLKLVLKATCLLSI